MMLHWHGGCADGSDGSHDDDAERLTLSSILLRARLHCEMVALWIMMSSTGT